MNFLAIFRILGLGLVMMAIIMTIPLAVSLVLADGRAGAYFLSALASAFFGASLLLIARSDSNLGTDIREAMLAVLLWWIGAPVLAGGPFLMSGMTPVDAYVEAVSALTTTGAWQSEAGARSHFSGALWRALLQWYGGLVSLAIAAAIFIRPLFLGIDTVQAPFARGERASHARAFLNAFRAFFAPYGMISVACFVSVALAGAPAADAVIMALSIPASGGFVWAADGFDAYGAPVAIAAAPFIALSGVSFILLASLALGRPQKIKDRETVAYGAAILGVAVLFWFLIGQGGLADALLRAPAQIFNAASLLSTNGFTLGERPPLAAAIVTVLIGGAAVSTAGGIKILRWLVILGRAREEIRRLIAPHGVFSAAREVDTLGVWIHFLAFTFVLASLTVIMTAGGHDFAFAAAAAAGALSNTGPVIGFADMGASFGATTAPVLKLALAAGMILGRVEAVSALVLLNRAFWRS